MLSGIGDNTNIQNNQVGQSSAADKTGLFGKTNPYDKHDKNFLIDELDISNTALKLYQKDQDVAKFAKLALSDPDDNSHNQIVASKVENGDIQIFEDEFVESLLNNTQFLKDLAG